jgi:hypothetical protein
MFINVLLAAFTLADTESAKKDSKSVSLFLAHLGSACVKAVRKMLMKLSPGLDAVFQNFIFTFPESSDFQLGMRLVFLYEKIRLTFEKTRLIIKFTSRP